MNNFIKAARHVLRSRMVKQADITDPKILYPLLGSGITGGLAYYLTKDPAKKASRGLFGLLMGALIGHNVDSFRKDWATYQKAVAEGKTKIPAK